MAEPDATRPPESFAERLNICRGGAMPIKKAAAYCGVSRSKFYEILDERKVRCVRIGARRLVPVSECDRILAELLENTP